MSDLKVKIIGGGFSGLIQAFYLVEKGLKVQIIEKENHLGGLLGTDIKNGFLSERAANAFIANKEIERICGIIGVNLVSVKKEAKKRFIYREGKMRRFPLKPLQFFKLIFVVLKIKLRLVSPLSDERQNLKDWVVEKFDSEFNDYLVEPGVQGIFGTQTHNLNASLVFGTLFKKYPKGSLHGSVSPEKGMQEFVDKMKAFLIKTDCTFVLKEEFSEIKEGEKIIFAVGLLHLKNLFNSNIIKLPESIKKTKVASLTSVKLLFKNKGKRIEGFGCLFPKKEGFNSLGVLFNHNIFPNRVSMGQSETWILNDEVMEFSKMSKMALERYVLSDRFKLFGERSEPYEILIDQWPQRIPIYDEYLKSFLIDLKEFKTSHLFVGNYLGQLGLSKLIERAQMNTATLLGEKNV